MDAMDESIAAFKKTLEINPRYSDAYYNLGVAYAKDQLDEAVKFLQKPWNTTLTTTNLILLWAPIIRPNGRQKESGIEEKSPK